MIARAAAVCIAVALALGLALGCGGRDWKEGEIKRSYTVEVDGRTCISLVIAQGPNGKDEQTKIWCDGKQAQ